MRKGDKFGIIEYILSKDKIVTHNFVQWCLTHPICKSLYIHCKALEISCNGIFWLSLWIAYIWLANSSTLYQMQLNFLIGLLLDIIIIALLKAFTRRRRPIPNDNSALTIGPDKFSFPSGHASRCSFILYFFIICYPVVPLFYLPIIGWCFGVCLSRILMQRHYILDVVCGILLGLIEACIIRLIWISESNAANIISYLSNDNLPGGAD